LTLALFIAGSSFARMRSVAEPADEATIVRTAEAPPRTLESQTRGAPLSQRSLGHLSDEAAMALVGTALLAVAAALKKTA
jgi:hypothetical protein